MRRPILISALAESDLIGIWEYSFEQWYAGQADDYLDELHTSIQLLADHPELGANRDYVREGYRVLFVNRHAVYYVVSLPKRDARRGDRALTSVNRAFDRQRGRSDALLWD